MMPLSSDLKKYSYFSSLSDNVLESLAKKITTVKVPAGTEIIKEGAVGNSFYFVKEGEFEVTKKTRSGQDAKLSISGSGQGFGEMALLTGSVRSGSVCAITGLVLYELSKTDFEEIILYEVAFRYMLTDKITAYKKYNMIKTLQPFALLSPDKMCALMDKMTMKEYRPGEDIIVQGDKGDFYYIIQSGRVAVLKKKKGEPDFRQLAVLGEGEAFGEEALIRDDPRNATCRAIQETIVYALDKKDFNKLVKASFLDNIFPEDIPLETYLDEYVVIDARVPTEYHEEHIYGAVNIPLEVLRQRCVDLDKTKRYITYCLNDSRGMVAAFLLRNRGFDAKCLRGGVSGWTGSVVTGSDGIHMPQR